MRRLLLLSCALLALPACDSSSYNNGYDDGYYDGQGTGTTTAGARFVDFSLDATGYTVFNDRTASYESDDIDSGTTRTAVERALATAGDGALVMLYIDNRLVNESEPGDQITYTALPLSRGFDELVLAPGTTPGTSTTIPVVGYTASYEFSFDNQDLFFDVVSSAAASDFNTNPRVLFDFVAPQRRVGNIPQGLTRLQFRLVTVPATAAKQGVDMTDYAAVVRAYGLPD